MKHLHLQIQNMACQNCVRRVAQLLEDLPGTQVHRVAVGEAEIAVDPDQADDQAVLQAMADTGYPASVSRGAGDKA